MQNKIAPTNDAQQKIVAGRTEVLVRKLDEHNKITTIHKGVVMQTSADDSWLRVFNPLPTQSGGDTSPEHSEWFPRTSKYVWCEVTNERTRERAITIPVALRPNV